VLRRCALALPVLLLMGCAEKIDTADLESKLEEQLPRSTGLDVRSVDCPDDIEIEKGKKFECTAEAPNGSEVRVQVTLTNEEGGFEARIVGPIGG